MDDETEPPARPKSYAEPAARPQVSHQWEMSAGISVAWLGYELTSQQMFAFDDAWDQLVVREEWRDWMSSHLIPASPFLVLAVVDGLDSRSLRKTKSGVSMRMPAGEVARADIDGNVMALFMGVIRDLHQKWAEVSGCPSPPKLTGHP